MQPHDVLISNKLGWLRVPLRGPEPTFEPGAWKDLGHDAEQRIDADGIIECWKQGNGLLGPGFAAGLVSVHDPDEYLAAAADATGRRRRFARVLDAYEALGDLRSRGEARAVGVGSKDWAVVREIADSVDLDWAMLACSLTVYRHPGELLAFVEQLRRRGVGIVNSAVFHAGFLTGGEFFDYRRPDPGEDRDLFAWRERFLAVCARARRFPLGRLRAVRALTAGRRRGLAEHEPGRARRRQRGPRRGGDPGALLDRPQGCRPRGPRLPLSWLRRQEGE